MMKMQIKHQKNILLHFPILSVKNRQQNEIQQKIPYVALCLFSVSVRLHYRHALLAIDKNATKTSRTQHLYSITV